MIRLAMPDLTVEGQVHQTGIGILNLLGSDLFQVINHELENSDGINWLTDYRKTNLVYKNYNFSDPSSLLKELLRVANSPLRKPIRKIIPPRELVAFFNRLQIVLDDRNDWIHHNSTFASQNLKTLILNVYPIAEKMNLSLIQECDLLLAKLDGIEPEIPETIDPIVPQSTSREESGIVKDIKEVLSQDEPTIGEITEGKFLDFSYVLHLTGEVRDRKTNVLLSEVRNETAQTLGALLIARKPTGGRLRISVNGVLAAYFEDHWGYLARVTPEQWFPNHIHHQI